MASVLDKGFETGQSMVIRNTAPESTVRRGLPLRVPPCHRLGRLRLRGTGRGRGQGQEGEEPLRSPIAALMLIMQRGFTRRGLQSNRAMEV